MKKKDRSSAFFADVLSTVSRYFIVLVILMAAIICFSGVRFVKSGNVALVLRFGHLVGDTYSEQVHEPGLMLAFPYIIDEVIMVPTESVIEQKVTTHYTDGYIRYMEDDGYVITGDQNVALISATVKYKITDPVQYALGVNNIEGVINGCVSNAMAACAACTPVDEILTSGKAAFGENTMKLAQEKLDIVKAGITIKNLELTQVSMPKEVSSIYNQVNASVVEANTMQENAQKYMDTAIPAAEAEANTKVSDANTEYSSAISDANQELVEFWGALEEFKTNKQLVKLRIYNDKISEAISKIGKVKIVQGGESRIFIE